MNLLTITNLYPNNVQIRHGIFVRERLRNLTAYAENKEELTIDIVAPIPSFPLGLRRALEPLKDVTSSSVDKLGFSISHPRFLAIPKLGNLLAPLVYAHAIVRQVRQHLQQYPDTTVIDAHFGFPDGAACTLVGRRYAVPVVVTLRGSDINNMADEWGIRSWTKWMLRSAQSIVVVSEALKDRAIALGCPAENIRVIRNGVDRSLFQPRQEREYLRRNLQLERPTMLSVGNLIPLKGHHLFVEALAQLPDWQGVIVGSGPMQEELTTLAETLQVADRLRIVSDMSQPELAEFYAAADVLVLASASEGLPNVVLEALSSGIPVIATNVGGVGEIMQSGIQGCLLSERSAASIVQAVMRLRLPSDEQRQALRSSIDDFDWDKTSQSLLDLFHNLLKDKKHSLSIV